MQQQMYRGIRKRSAQTLFGLPLIDIALGPDLEKGEIRGRAYGIIAIGDIARGWFALGGVASGIVAVGGVAFGVLAFGGAAIGGVAMGGATIGYVAIGGAAAGYYAFGGGAFGKYVVSAMQRSQEAVEFFKHWLPFLPIR